MLSGQDSRPLMVAWFDKGGSSITVLDLK